MIVMIVMMMILGVLIDCCCYCWIIRRIDVEVFAIELEVVEPLICYYLFQ
jgi:hypothetical protein